MAPAPLNMWGNGSSSPDSSTTTQVVGNGLSQLPPRSFKEALPGNTLTTSTMLNIVRSSIKGVPAIMISDAEVEKLA